MFLRALLSRLKRRREGPRLYWLTHDLAFSRAPLEDEWHDLRAAGIRCVVDLRAETPERAGLAAASDLLYLRLPVDEGGVPDDDELARVADWVGRGIAEQGPVLIHCREGLGRSPLVACAALVRLGLPLAGAYGALRRARPDIALSDEQARALERFARREATLRGGRAAD